MSAWKPYVGVRRVRRELPALPPLPDEIKGGPWIVYHDEKRGKRYWTFVGMEFVSKERDEGQIIRTEKALIACVELIATIYAGHQSITIEQVEKHMNQRQLRTQFWLDHPKFRRQSTGTPGKMRPKTQNEYPADVRMAFVDYVDRMERDGQISRAVAENATLE